MEEVEKKIVVRDGTVNKFKKSIESHNRKY